MDANTLAPHVTRYLRLRAGAGTDNRKSLRSVRGRLRSLSDHFGRRPLSQFTRRAIERWLATLGTMAPSSRSAYLASVRTFTAWLAAEQVIDVDPCIGVPSIRRPRSVPRALSPAQVAEILAACDDDRDRAIIWLMVGCGLRRAEVAAANWDDYDQNERTLLVHGKGGHERLLPVPQPVAEALSKLRVRANCGPVFRNRTTGHRVTDEWVGKRAGEIMVTAGVKQSPWDGVSGHSLRHSAASDVLDQCGDLRVVQQMLGHASLSTTSIYLRRAGLGQLREAMEGRAYEGPMAA